MNDLTGKVAIVTGAGQGAGGGCALALASAGASLVLAGRTLGKLERMATAVEARGAKAHCIAGDVTERATISALVKDAVEKFGRIDVLVNAAQAPEMRAARLLDIEDEAIAELWNSGPVATLALMRACHPVMRANGGGSIINFASGALRAPEDYGVYAGCKAAIETLSRAAAIEWGPDNIRVNTVIPFVMSPALELDLSAEVQAQVGGKLPLGRIGRPEEDIGRAVAFLAGDGAAYVTGNLIKLDGGGWNQR
jgi:NAD(P)-dependent dehydrogenase (short-subunit alcohol dehydrogenase family)